VKGGQPGEVHSGLRHQDQYQCSLERAVGADQRDHRWRQREQRDEFTVNPGVYFSPAAGPPTPRVAVTGSGFNPFGR